MDQTFMARAIQLSIENVYSGRGGPFGAVIVKDNRMVAEGTNEVTVNNDPTAHAEVVAIRGACRKLGVFQLRGCEIYTSCEPCPMCLGAIYWAHLARIYFANSAAAASLAGFDDSLIYKEMAQPHSARRIPMMQLMREEALVAFRDGKQNRTKSATNIHPVLKFAALAIWLCARRLNLEAQRLLDRFFKLRENHTSVKQEMLGGLTTFVTMAYIIVVNPQILAQAGMPADGVVFATCISSAAATLVMGLYANYPIALAPGMSLNAYFTYSVCMGMHVPWRAALALVFFSGTLFLVLTLTRVREQIVNGIPDCLKHSTAAGIGMFIAFVGMRNAKLIVANPATFVGLGKFSDKEVQTACFGLLMMLVLVSRRFHGAILIGVFAATLLGIVRGIAKWPGAIFGMPHPSSTFLQLDFRGATHLGLLEILFAFLFVDLFDNVGTLVGVCEQGGFVKDGKIPRVGRVLVADAVGTMVGGLAGTSTVTSYIESSAGVAAGARTGLSNLAVAALFLLAIFCSPLATAIPAYATAPALILVGVLMTQSIAQVQWSDFSEAVPAFITMLAMPLTFSIATGLSLGLIAYTVVKIAAGKLREINPLIWILTILFILRYAYLAAA